ncbi:hypothetical protein ES703_78560 [subsurface metagenome]
MYPPNDWEIKNCLRLSLAILLATLGLIGLAALGFDIPILRQIAGFIFLTFVPGTLILRILKIHNINVIESLVYSVGLSLAFVMFSGAFINFALPFIGISHPISLVPITSALAIFTIILIAIAYVRDRGFTGSEKATPGQKLQLPPVLFLILFLLLTILGVVLIDSYQNNILLLICVVAIAGLVGLAAFGKFIQSGIYPLAIFIIGLCLLYQTTLISPYLIGSDIYTEHYFYQLVAGSGLWDASIPSTVNSCLSITILAPIYSLILNINGLWIFKTIYPLLFALVPLILFHIFSQQMSHKNAFLAAFFFVVVPTFSLEMISLCRQQIAELFFVLVILLLVDRKLNLGPKLALAIIFAMSMVVSHYALGMIGFIYMGLFLPLVFIIRSGAFQKAWGWLTKKFGGLPRSLIAPGALPAKALVIVVAIYFISGFAWYGAIASRVNLGLVSNLWTGQTTTITTEPLRFFEFDKRDVLIQTALGLDFPQASPQGKGFRILQYITQLFLIIGCLRLIFRPRHLRFTAEYIALSVTSILLLLACIFVPYFANQLNTTRWYHIALITLAPFCILGGEAIWLGISSLWHKIRHIVPGMSLPADYHSVIASEAKQSSLSNAEDSPGSLKFLALAVLIPYFLFTSGFVYEVTGQKVTDKIDAPYSIALSSYRLDLAGVFYWRDGAAAKWLAQEAGNEAKVYTDGHTHKLLKLHDFTGQITSLPRDASDLQEDAYIYFSARNIDKKEITFALGPGLRQHISFDDVPGLTTAIESKNRIYNNGGAQILAPGKDSF